MNIEGYETALEVAKRLKVDRSRVLQMVAEGRFPDAFRLTKGKNAPWIFPKGAKPTAMPDEKVEEYRARWRKQSALWRQRHKEKK